MGLCAQELQQRLDERLLPGQRCTHIQSSSPPPTTRVLNLLWLREGRGLIRFRVFASIVVRGPLLLRSHFHDRLFGLVFPAKGAGSE